MKTASIKVLAVLFFSIYGTVPLGRSALMLRNFVWTLTVLNLIIICSFAFYIAPLAMTLFQAEWQLGIYLLWLVLNVIVFVFES
jgi:hypothetical protein